MAEGEGLRQRSAFWVLSGFFGVLCGPFLGPSWVLSGSFEFQGFGSASGEKGYVIQVTTLVIYLNYDPNPTPVFTRFTWALEGFRRSATAVCKVSIRFS